MDKILILDFGSQTTALIGRRLRDLGVCAEFLPGDTPFSRVNLAGVKGVIFSGSPESVNGAGVKVDAAFYECGLPILGICYGFQRIACDAGGAVEALAAREAGGVQTVIEVEGEPPPALRAFFKTVGEKASASFTAWFSHGDGVAKLPSAYGVFARSDAGYIEGAYHREKPILGVQFHPEAANTENGAVFLGAFAFDVCKAQVSWSMENYVDTLCAEIRAKLQDKTALLLISGGVDSSVAAALLLKSVPEENIHLMYIDTGLMRSNETAEVKAALEKLGAKNLHIIDAETAFLSALSGVDNPEEKRRIIGDIFIKVQEKEVARLSLPADYFLVQGTLYTDLIESGLGIGSKAHNIKSHHNVGSPLVARLRGAGRIIEPLSALYKDEVRDLGVVLGLPSSIIERHPFPGPGLAVRILGEVTSEKCDILRRADEVYITELKSRGLYNEIWQAFAVLLPVRSVGVSGDGRKYGYVLALRAVTSKDGMTADVYPFPSRDLIEISSLITNKVSEIGRVVYDVSSKPPATIEWE